ncbi:MAG: C-type lectin domain-containing protein [Polyangiaceae bacterium]
MRFRHAAMFFSIAACAIGAACIPNLITDPEPDGGSNAEIGQFCGDGYITLGQYDGGFADLQAGEQCDPGEGGAVGCSNNCRVECDGGKIDPVTNHCYFAVAPASALDVAEQSCEMANGHVVTFADDRERTFVLENLKSSFAVVDASAFWSALSVSAEQGGYVPALPNDELEPGWSPSCSGCYAAPNVDGSIPKLLNDAGGQCILDLPRLGWSQFPCSQIPFGIPVICEREPPGSLAIPCAGTCVSVPATAGKKRYFFSPVQVTADQAHAQCTELGGSLVVFDSPEERETLLREVARTMAESSFPVKEAWIGLSTDDGGPWTWDNGTALTASPWGDNQPVAPGTGPVRAYVVLGTQNYDIQLAHDDSPALRSYICQH